MTVPTVLNGESISRKAEYRYKKASIHRHKIFKISKGMYMHAWSSKWLSSHNYIEQKINGLQRLVGWTSAKTKQYENNKTSILPEIIIFCDVILCNLEERYQLFGAISVLPWQWTEQIPPQQCWQLLVRLHGITP